MGCCEQFAVVGHAEHKVYQLKQPRSVLADLSAHRRELVPSKAIDVISHTV